MKHEFDFFIIRRIIRRHIDDIQISNFLEK